jgi:hypothetical protein
MGGELQLRVYKKYKKCGDIVSTQEYEKGFLMGYSSTYGLYKEVQEDGSIKYYEVTEEGEMLERKIGRQNQADAEQQEQNRYKVMIRAKNLIKDLINSNAYSWSDKSHRTVRPKFLTLTFKDNIKDLKTANMEYKKFIKRLNYYIKTEIDNNYIGVQYVAVVEFQKRGAVHYHVLLFNMPFIKWNVILEKWGLGGAYIEGFRDKSNKEVSLVYDEEKDCFMADKSEVHNIGAYITKTMEYMAKSFDDDRLRGEKCYFTSRNLKKPVLLNDIPKNKKQIEQLVPALSDECLVFSNAYINEYIGMCQYNEYNIKFDRQYDRNILNEMRDNIIKKHWCTSKSASHYNED